ncbi:MAG: CDP-alcohol phosphatidyltransferase family protein [Gemmatimonadota bacterium]
MTVPNLIALLRLVGTAPMLWTAYTGHRTAFFWIVFLLLASDWLDGKLARALDQRTELGARLDSVADWLMYGAMGVAFWWLEPVVIRDNAGLIAGVFATWGVSAGVALLRFRRLPSYHNRLAKLSWLLAALAAVLLLLADDPRLMPWAFLAVILTNLEGAAIGAVLPEWRADVGWIGEAWRLRRGRQTEVRSDAGP